MDITWFGQTCFRLEAPDSISVVTDPYPPDVGHSLPSLRADIVTVSRHIPSCVHTSAVRGPFKLLEGPGEYEIGGVFITGIATFADDKQGVLRGLNTIFAFDFDGLTVCNLGRLGHVPKQSQVKDVGTVSVLLVPVGGGESLTPAQASEVISLFEPDIAVPMHYRVPELKGDLDTVDHFLREMGLEEANRHDVLTVSQPAPSEKTEIVVLEPSLRSGG